MDSIVQNTQPIIQSFTNSFTNSLSYASTHKSLIIGALTFVIYLVLSYLFMFKYKHFGLEKYNLYTNIAIVIVGVSLFLSIINKVYFPSSGIAPTFLNIGKRVAFITLGLAIIIGLIYLIAKNSILNDSMSLIITVGLTIGGLYLLNKYLNNLTIVKDIKSSPIFSIIYHALFLIPCMIVDGTTSVYSNVKDTPSFVYKILAIEALLIAAYFLYPKFSKIFMTHDSKLLLGKPVYLNESAVIGTYEDLKPKKQNFIYNYGLSFWSFIDNIGPNFNENSTGFTNILNYGNKPSIMYNAKTHTLRVTTKNGIDGTEVLYEDQNLPLQKWNYFVINYDGGNTDIFLNGNLVSTKKGVIPFMKHDNVIVGNENGISGGITNVQYYNRPITKNTINFMYNTYKNSSMPPKM